MRTLYIRNVPDEVGERLERLAEREGMSLSAFAARELTAYDATYVAVAEALDADLVTADQRLTRAPGIRCRTTLVHD